MFNTHASFSVRYKRYIPGAFAAVAVLVPVGVVGLIPRLVSTTVKRVLMALTSF